MMRRTLAPGRAAQRGATLLVGLIMLVLMTLMAVSTFNLGKSSLQIVGNMQQHNEVVAAAQETVEEVVSNARFSTTPNSVFLNPCTTANTKCIDVNGDGTPDVTVTLTPAPACVEARVLQMSEMDFSLQADRDCTTGQNQQMFGLVGGTGLSTGDTLCASTLWEITAVATDNVTQASSTVVQGASTRVLKDAVSTNCP